MPNLIFLTILHFVISPPFFNLLYVCGSVHPLHRQLRKVDMRRRRYWKHIFCQVPNHIKIKVKHALTQYAKRYRTTQRQDCPSNLTTLQHLQVNFQPCCIVKSNCRDEDTDVSKKVDNKDELHKFLRTPNGFKQLSNEK